MPSAFLQTFRSRWFATCVHVGLWCVLYVAVTHLGGKTPEFHIADSATPPSPGPVPVANMDGLFSATRWPNPSALKTIPNPFFTSYFVPVPSPVPPPPTTRKVEVTYQGFYQAGDSVKHAIVKVGERFVAAVPGAPVTTNEIFVAAVPGAPVTTNLFIADMSLSSLVLTNPPGATNVIPLSIKKEIEVPIQ